jgi:hypothetical protein
MSDERTVRVAHEDIVPDQARDLRVSAWFFIFDCYAKKKATRTGGPDDAERSPNEIHAKDIILK